MRYRILTDGKYFRIEKVNNNNEWIKASPCFYTENNAEDYAKKLWGASRERVREWRIC